MIATLFHELRGAARALLRSPGFALTSIAMLSIGLGLAMYMFGAIQSFMLRELPFPNGDRLLHIEYADGLTQNDSIEVPTADFLTLRREARSFERLEAFSQGTINLASDEGRPERYNGAFISAGSFAALGVSPLLGAGFQPGDDQVGAEATVMIGYALWQQRFNAAADIVGRSLRINGQSARVVGVMPKGFAFPFNNTVWVPLKLPADNQPRREQISLEVFGTLAEGRTRSDADAELNSLIQRIEQADPNPALADRAVIKPYSEEFVGRNTARILGTMFAAVLLVLAIACVNVANLMIARGVQRTRESAIRSAIGASRLRLMVVSLSEALLIALIALTIGSLLAYLGGEATMQMVRSSESPPPYWMTEYRFDGLSAVFAALSTLLVVALAGLWPAWRSARMAQSEGMRQGGRAASGRLGGGLTMIEIALCMVLLVTAGLTVRSVIERERMPLAFDSEQVLSGRLGLFEGDYPDDGAILRFVEQLRLKLAELPGVEQVGFTSSVPMSFAGGQLIELAGQAPSNDAGRPFVLSIAADPEFFSALNIPLQRGRGFSAADNAEAPRVALLSQPVAERFWPQQDPIGQRFRLGDSGSQSDWIEVVGVVAHVPHVGEEVEMGALYLPFAQSPSRFFSPVLRTREAPMASAEGLRQAVSAVDPDLPVYFLRSLQDWVQLAAFDHWLMAWLFGIFGAFAVLLAAAGLYAVLAYQVGQRVREIGVRRALGAQDRGIIRMVLGQGAWQLAIGVGVGLLLALGFAQLLSSQLFGITAYDPLTFASVAVLLALVTALASLVPTRRALGVDPMIALRYE